MKMKAEKYCLLRIEIDRFVYGWIRDTDDPVCLLNRITKVIVELEPGISPVSQKNGFGR